MSLACPVDVPLDMIFLLDTSDKISSAGFEYMKNLVITTASILKMSGYESTRLAVFQFSAQGNYFWSCQVTFYVQNTCESKSELVFRV